MKWTVDEEDAFEKEEAILMSAIEMGKRDIVTAYIVKLKKECYREKVGKK